MNRDLRLLLVIIARNNAPTLPAVAASALATGHELLVIDDGSDDNCLATVAHLPCQTLRFGRARGYEAAVQEGATLAAQIGYDAIVTLAGDGRHDPADVPLLAAEAKRLGCPCLVIGSTQVSPASTDFWLRLECGIELSDPADWFRLYPVKELLALKFSRKSCSFAIESVVRFAWSGIPVVSVEVTVDHPVETVADSIGRIKARLALVWLHGRLVARRLVPLPHQRFIPEESLHKKVIGTISQNPFRVLGSICREHASPLWLAMAVWLGIFIGALPLFSVHTIAIIYAAHRLHLNKVAAVAASQFCMPPVVPVLCIQIGYYLRKGELLLDFSWQRWILEIPERFWEWLIGSLLLGPLLGFIGAGIMYWLAVKYKGLSYED